MWSGADLPSESGFFPYYEYRILYINTITELIFFSMFDSLDMIRITYWGVLHLWITMLLQSQADNIKNCDTEW